VPPLTLAAALVGLDVAPCEVGREVGGTKGEEEEKEEEEEEEEEGEEEGGAWHEE
jgi:ribosomal protein L12E/L44/L45/RPP1/RPP2